MAYLFPQTWTFGVVVSTLGLGHDSQRPELFDATETIQHETPRTRLRPIASAFQLFDQCQDNKPSGDESYRRGVPRSGTTSKPITPANAHRMEQTLHPSLPEAHDSRQYPDERENCFADGAGNTLPGPGDIPLAERTEQISVLDVSGDIASAKLLTYSTLGGLLDALEIGWTVEDSLSCPANRQLVEGQCGDPTVSWLWCC